MFLEDARIRNLKCTTERDPIQWEIGALSLDIQSRKRRMYKLMGGFLLCFLMTAMAAASAINSLGDQPYCFATCTTVDSGDLAATREWRNTRTILSTV